MIYNIFLKAFNRYKDRKDWKPPKINYSNYLDSEDLTIPEKYEEVEGLWKYLDEEKGNKVFCFKKIEKLMGNENKISFKYSIDIKFSPDFNDIEKDLSPDNFKKILNSVLANNYYTKKFFKNNNLKIKVSHGETLFKKENGKVYKTINIDYIFTHPQNRIEIRKISYMKIRKQLISVIKKPLDATIDYVINNF